MSTSEIIAEDNNENQDQKQNINSQAIKPGIIYNSQVPITNLS